VESAKFAGLPMAEPSEREYKRLAETFCKAYNSEHNSSFKFSHVNPKPDDADFFLKDDTGNTLPIQHTRCEHIENFFHSTDIIGRFQNNLEQKLKELGVPNSSIVLHYLKLPNKETETGKLINELGRFIDDNSKLGCDIDRCEIYKNYKKIYKHGKATPELQYGATGFSEKMGRYIEDIEIEKNSLIVIFSYSPSQLQPKPLDSEAEDLLPATDKKNSRYGSSKKNVIFLIESYPSPPAPESIEKTRKALRTKPPGFREVWAIFRGYPPFCKRIWPSANNEEVACMR